MRACSACAGDYEDPDRTAGEEFEELLEEHEEIILERKVVEQVSVVASTEHKSEERRAR